jgi:taurine dioxygenase
MVHIVDLPSRGGDTQFVDARAAYDDLPPNMKKKVASLKSLHVYESSNSPRKMAALAPEELANMPSTLQPLVIRHPDSGRPAVYLNTARMEGIEGMGTEEANALIAQLFDHSTQAKYEYRHVYKKGDVVIWDNRSVMHQANADVDPSELRRLHRVILGADQLEAYQPAHEIEGFAA